MLALADKFLSQLFKVVDPGHGDQGKAAQVAVGEHGLGISVADYADAGVPVKLVKLVLKARTEVGILQIVYLTFKMARLVDGGNAAAAGAKVKLIVRAVEYVGNALLLAYHSKETAHCSLF